MNVILMLLSSWMISPANADEVTLHFIPSPAGIDWSRPQTLAASTVINQVASYNGGERHEIGHVDVEINCGDRHFFTDVTSVTNSEEQNDILKLGYGLGIVLTTFQGTMDTSAAIEADLNSMHATGRSSFMQFNVSPDSCTRMLSYYDEYIARGYNNTYSGLNARPRDGQSSGCSAFGMSFLQLAGLQIPLFEQRWMRTLIMPRRFIGSPLTGNHVSILTILLAFSAQWDQNLSDDGILVNAWDPELMNTWTRQAAHALRRGHTLNLPWAATRTMNGNSPGIIVDATNVATPTDPIFTVPAPANN
jgi:hypothetical protein